MGDINDENVDRFFLMKVDDTWDGTVDWIFSYIFNYSNVLPDTFIICKDMSYDHVLRLRKNLHTLSYSSAISIFNQAILHALSIAQ